MLVTVSLRGTVAAQVEVLIVSLLMRRRRGLDEERSSRGVYK